MVDGFIWDNGKLLNLERVVRVIAYPPFKNNT